MNKLSIRDLELAGKRVFVRVDFNVPLEKGDVTDDTRITRNAAHAKTGARTRSATGAGIASGTAQGQAGPEVQLAPVAGKLAELLERPVEFASDCVGRGGSEEPRAGRRRRPAAGERALTIPKKKPMTKRFRANSRRFATDYSFAMRSAPRIARTLPSWGSRNS